MGETRRGPDRRGARRRRGPPHRRRQGGRRAARHAARALSAAGAAGGAARRSSSSPSSDTALPPLPGVPIWIEPAEPRHPLAGIVHALEGAGAAAGIAGLAREILVSAGDLPFVGAGRSSSGSRMRTPAARRPSCRAPAGACSRCSRATRRPRYAPLAAALRARPAAVADGGGRRAASRGCSSSTTRSRSSTSTRRRTC